MTERSTALSRRSALFRAIGPATPSDASTPGGARERSDAVLRGLARPCLQTTTPHDVTSFSTTRPHSVAQSPVRDRRNLVCVRHRRPIIVKLLVGYGVYKSTDGGRAGAHGLRYSLRCAPQVRPPSISRRLRGVSCTCGDRGDVASTDRLRRLLDGALHVDDHTGATDL